MQQCALRQLSQTSPVLRYLCHVPNSTTIGSTRKLSRAAGAAPIAKSVLPTAAAPSRILFVGGIPARTEADVLQQQLEAVCIDAGCKPTRVQVCSPFYLVACDGKCAHFQPWSSLEVNLTGSIACNRYRIRPEARFHI
jgi:hypothetical protein